MFLTRTRLAVLFLAALPLSAPAFAIDEAHAAKAKAATAKGVAFLKGHQDEQGSWGDIGAEDAPKMKNPGVVGVTSLALSALLDSGVAKDDAAVRKAVAFLLSKAKPSGEIGDGVLENYNTSIALSALSRLKDDAEIGPRVREIIKKGQDYLIGKQWKEGMVDPKGEAVKEGHPFFGGSGYGRHGRPDMSNTQFMLQALRDTGVPGDDPAMKRALAFLEANQGISANKIRGSQIENDGGFVYATSIDKDHINQAETFDSEDKMAANTEPSEPGASRLRTYGSMTYAGFKSYLYAKLDKDDARVKAALGWIKAHYTLEGNPGIPFDEAKKTHMQGMFYYYITFGRALSAWGSPTLEVNAGKDPATGKPVTKTIDWQNDLTDKLASLQKEDGSWTNDADRWLEGDPRLVTAYAVIALNNALGLEK